MAIDTKVVRALKFDPTDPSFRDFGRPETRYTPTQLREALCDALDAQTAELEALRKATEKIRDSVSEEVENQFRSCDTLLPNVVGARLREMREHFASVLGLIHDELDDALLAATREPR